MSLVVSYTVQGSPEALLTLIDTDLLGPFQVRFHVNNAFLHTDPGSAVFRKNAAFLTTVFAGAFAFEM